MQLAKHLRYSLRVEALNNVYLLYIKGNPSSCTQVFNWVKVRTLRGSTPPVDFMLFKEGLCLSGCALGIIVLHETMVGELFADKRNQRRL